MQSGKKININKGEIWLVQLSYTKTDYIEHEMMDKRPCIVLKVNKFVNLSTIIPLTSNLQVGKFHHTYTINPSQKNGLTKKSIAMLYQIRSLSHKRFIKKWGKIDDVDLKRIKNILIDYFNLILP